MAEEFRQMPMFPLGRVVLPGETVPLRIFESRYLQMLGDIEAGSDEFGVVLISRGSEVGGGEQRCDVGTVCRVVRDVPLGDAQRAIVALAGGRLRIVEWLADDPYPRAFVADHRDERPAQTPDIDDLVARTRTLFALASELGAATSAVDLDMPADVEKAVWHLSSLVPLGEHDRQQLLEAPDFHQRGARLGGFIDDAIEELRLRLGAV